MRRSLSSPALHDAATAAEAANDIDCPSEMRIDALEAEVAQLRLALAKKEQALQDALGRPE